MREESEKIEKAIAVLQKIAKGTNPVNGEPIDEASFLNDPRIIRCFFFVSEILQKVANGSYDPNRGKLIQFVITQEEKEKVHFPEGEIGVNEFSKCVNACIDLSKSKKLTGMELNKRLKIMGILSEEKLEDGKTKTTVNENSLNFGFEIKRKSYNGNSYDMVVMNDQGKKYLLDNLESIMQAGEKNQSS